MDILRKYKKDLTNLAEMLVEREVVEGDDIKRAAGIPVPVTEPVDEESSAQETIAENVGEEQVKKEENIGHGEDKEFG